MNAHWLTLDEHPDPADWLPLERLARVAAGSPGVPPIDPDDFLYCARIEREGRPVLHVYKHMLTGRYLNVDETVRAWRYAGREKIGNESVARYEPIASIAEAAERADLARSARLAHRRHPWATDGATPGAPTGFRTDRDLGPADPGPTDAGATDAGATDAGATEPEPGTDETVDTAAVAPDLVGAPS
jgi:hypothetical protein